MTATLAHIFRHPIKAHGHQSLASVAVRAGHTLPWDRRWAVVHEHAKTDGHSWAPCANFSRGAKVGTLMAISAEIDEDSGRITLLHPERPPLSFNPTSEIDAFLGWVEPLMPTDRAQSTGLVEVRDVGMTDTDYPSISVASIASLDALAERIGQPLDPRRFRANLWLDGLDPWEEFNWIGQELELGGVTFRVEERITRCKATMANPETGETDADTLAGIEAGWGHKDFGIYVVAQSGGTLSVGDKLTVRP